MVILRSRRGVSTLGCLFSALIAAVVLYYAIDVGRVYWKYYKLKDEMTTAARFAQHTPDEDIRRQLAGVARDLELPPEAQRFVIRRTQEPPIVSIRTEYRVTIELPFHNRVLTLKPNVTVRQ
ncbi:MAG TPA: hypothetical protein VGQ69_13435 [Gemmatimonadales bacterium]|jgi:hypothetical protein|nr:hypothetical protein [Gemmatimonadales bacterium]